MIKAVFFDFDGVLIDSIPAHDRAWRSILSEIGIELPPGYIQMHEGEKAEDTVTRLLIEHGRNASREFVADLTERKRTLYRPSAPKGLIPAARTLIDNLHSVSVQCNIVTGSVRKNLDATLSPEEMELFEYIAAADDYQRGKPAPDPYLTGLRISGKSAAESIVLENAPLGIEAAVSAGIFTVAITTTLSPEYLSRANAVISDHQELLDYVYRN